MIASGLIPSDAIEEDSLQSTPTRRVDVQVFPAYAHRLSKAWLRKVAEQALDSQDEGVSPTISLVIADDETVHGLNRDYRGLDETTDVLLEIAYFDPEAIGVTGRKLGIATDARTRFERGVDPAFLDEGLDILTSLILKTCGGTPGAVTRAGQPPVEPKVVGFDPKLTASLGGIEVPEAEQKRILESLDFEVGSDWQVTCPPRRHDIEGPADLVEEVVRIYGLDKVESVALPRAEGVAKPTASPLQLTERRLRRAAAARGLNEAVTWSFLPVAEAEHFADAAQLWVLDNPISEDMKAMRPSLLPGLLMAAKRNADRGADGSRLFEIGRRYFRGANGASDEKPTLGVVLAGEKSARGWADGKAKSFDAYDAKAEAMALLEAAGAPVDNLMVFGDAGAQFHPGQSGTLRLGPKNVLARFGALHPATLKAFDLDGPAVAVEIHLDAIPAKKNAGFARAAYAPPALQAITRDFAFLVPADLSAGDLVKAVRGADKQAIVEARIFDVFAGAGVPEGKKSLALEVTLQPGEKSFTEAEIKALSDKIVAAAGKQGAELRG